MATAAKRTTPKAATVDDEVDLLGELDDKPGPAASSDDEETFDLLDGLSEDEGTPWIPDDSEDPSPPKIQGRVTYVGTVPSDYSPEDVPYLVLEAPDGTVWSIRGYATALRNQLTKLNVSVGDFIACGYFGEKGSKNGRTYKDYKAIKAKAKAK